MLQEFVESIEKYGYFIAIIIALLAKIAVQSRSIYLLRCIIKNKINELRAAAFKKNAEADELEANQES